MAIKRRERRIKLLKRDHQTNHDIPPYRRQKLESVDSLWQILPKRSIKIFIRFDTICWLSILGKAFRWKIPWVLTSNRNKRGKILCDCSNQLSFEFISLSIYSKPTKKMMRTFNLSQIMRMLNWNRFLNTCLGCMHVQKMTKLWNFEGKLSDYKIV